MELVRNFTDTGELTPIDIVAEITGLSYDEIRKANDIVNHEELDTKPRSVEDCYLGAVCAEVTKHKVFAKHWDKNKPSTTVRV